MTAAELAALWPGGARERAGRYHAHCPAHDDQRESLTFRDGDGLVLIRCHAGTGCSLDAILTAFTQTAGRPLTRRDLRHDANGNGHGGPAAAARRIVAVYPYRDEAGALLYEVVRYAPKAFRQRRPDGQGGHVWTLAGVRRVLYRLPELRARLAARPAAERVVYVAEGEKDADALWALGLPATTNAAGAGKWSPDCSAQLVDAGAARVVVFADNDAPGEAHAATVADACLAAGLPALVVRLPGLPPKGDVSDYLDAGRGLPELLAAVQAAEAAPASAPRPAAGRLVFTRLSDLLEEPEEATAWLVEGRLPTGGLSLLAGKPKAGKSTLARGLALAVSRGEPWLGWATVTGPVFYLALEEKRAEVRRHFRAMGATGEDVRIFVAPSPQDGLEQLRRAAESERPVLIIVDPLLRLVRVRDANDYAAVTQALEPLLALARETGAHVLAVHHLGKVERDGGDAIIGSTAFYAAVDTALLLRRTEQYRTLSTIQRYGDDLEEITLTLDKATGWVSPGPSRREADQAKAADAILDYLASQPEPVEESAIHEAVEGRKGVKARALRALYAEQRVIRLGGGKRGDPYRYSLPADRSADSGSLVPVYIREPENQKSETTLTRFMREQ